MPSGPREARNWRDTHDNISTWVDLCVQNTPCHMRHAAQESVVKVGEYVTVKILASWANTWTSHGPLFHRGLLRVATNGPNIPAEDHLWITVNGMNAWSSDTAQ